MNANLQLLKPREMAELLAVSERTLFTLTKDGTIPHVRLSERTVRYRLGDVEQAIERLMSRSSAGSALE